MLVCNMGLTLGSWLTRMKFAEFVFSFSWIFPYLFCPAKIICFRFSYSSNCRWALDLRWLLSWSTRPSPLTPLWGRDLSLLVSQVCMLWCIFVVVFEFQTPVYNLHAFHNLLSIYPRLWGFCISILSNGHCDIMIFSSKEEPNRRALTH